MPEAALSLAFFDPAHARHGTLRTGTALLFEGESPFALAEGATLESGAGEYRAAHEERFDLTFRPVSGAATMADTTTRVCEVRGRLGDVELDCLGTATESARPPAWAELDALRALSIILDAEHAVLAVALRPRGARGHGGEAISAHLLSGGEMLAVEDARISTVYDADGRQRSAGLELWLPEEDFPRRAAGTVVAGTSLELEGLRVNAAVFTWQMDGRDGVGAYEITVRNQPLEAA